MKRLKDNSTEEKILEAAKDVFMKHGLYGARMQDIADTAGMNKALLHYYFRNKEKLFDKIFEGALQKYFQQMDVLSDASLPIKQKLFKYVDNIVDFFSEYPQMSMFIIKEVSINPELFKQKVMAAKKTTKALGLIKILEEGIANKEIKKTDVVMFMINLQSLCSYPFIAAPLFKQALKSNNKDLNKDFNTTKLKQAVKLFIENTLFK